MANILFPSLQRLYVYNTIQTKNMLREHHCHSAKKATLWLVS